MINIVNDKYKKLLLITLLFNIIIFTYYLANSDINPSIDAFYYLALADSFYQGTGLANITTDPPQPIYTPQNGIVFIHILLQSIGLHNADSRLLAIKLINYVGFLLFVYIFYNIFRQLKISSEITFLSLGILLSGAHFTKTIIQPLNEGFWCLLTAIVFFLAISNENKWSFLKVATITILSIALANFRLNGPIIVLSIAISYFILSKFKKSLAFFLIFIMSYASIYIILTMFNADYSGFQTVYSLFTFNYLINHPLMILVFTVPGVFIGITGSKYMSLYYMSLWETLVGTGKWLITIFISLFLLLFYGYYLRKFIKLKNFQNILIMFYIMLLIIFLEIMPGSDSRYIIMILPFTLLAIATYFNDSKKLRLCLGIFLLLTILVSMYRLIWWDSIYFNNNKSYVGIQDKMSEPYELISETPKYSYYIFRRPCKNAKDINKNSKYIVVFGTDKYNKLMLQIIHDKFKIDHIEYLDHKIIAENSRDAKFNTIKITTNIAVYHDN
jgi:hypothetical protein